MLHHVPRLVVATLATGILLVGILAATVVRFRSELREDIRQKIIERDAAVLYPVARQQLADEAANSAGRADSARRQLESVLKTAHQDGMLAVSIFDAEGNTIDAVPATLLFVDLPVDDYVQLLAGQPISRFHPRFRLDRYFAGIAETAREAPVLEVLLPLQRPQTIELLGIAQYFIDARPLARELAAIDPRINRLTAGTLTIGAALIGVVVTGAALGVRRAQRLIAERNERLARANFELTLAAKASALGQITSHLIHGLQGSVAGLRAAVAGSHGGDAVPDWRSAADYTDRIQAMIQETVALLSDTGAKTMYELTGHELAGIIRDRNAPAAKEKGVLFTVQERLHGTLDSHRGSLLCLIASNLVQNAIEATAPGKSVKVELSDQQGDIALVVTDEGHGIPEMIRTRLFEPGSTGRVGGTGLGLAISQLLARQIGATLALKSTGAEGTAFRLSLPRG